MKQEKPNKERSGKYEEKLSVKGSFFDIMKAAVKDANNKSAIREPKPEKNSKTQ